MKQQNLVAPTVEYNQEGEVVVVSEITEVKPLTGVSNEIIGDILSPPASHAPVSWSFPQFATMEDEMIENLVMVRIPSPENTRQEEIAFELGKQADASKQPNRVAPTVEYNSEGEEEDLFFDVPEPSIDSRLVGDEIFQKTSVKRQQPFARVFPQEAYHEVEAVHADGVVEMKPESYNGDVVLPSILEKAEKSSRRLSLACLQEEKILDNDLKELVREKLNESTAVEQIASSDLILSSREVKPVNQVMSVEDRASPEKVIEVVN